jgi:hypothetical protein
MKLKKKVVKKMLEEQKALGAGGKHIGEKAYRGPLTHQPPAPNVFGRPLADQTGELQASHSIPQSPLG